LTLWTALFDKNIRRAARRVRIESSYRQQTAIMLAGVCLGDYFGLRHEVASTKRAFETFYFRLWFEIWSV
jgi:hypothetical protein